MVKKRSAGEKWEDRENLVRPVLIFSPKYKDETSKQNAVLIVTNITFVFWVRW